jgi:hypothetical protein
MCCKKLAVLVTSKGLDGFQLNLLDNTHVVQRYVFQITGSLDCDGLDKAR